MPRARPSWVRREFGGAALGDARLQHRLLDLAAAFFARPRFGPVAAATTVMAGRHGPS